MSFNNSLNLKFLSEYYADNFTEGIFEDIFDNLQKYDFSN